MFDPTPQSPIPNPNFSNWRNFNSGILQFWSDPDMETDDSGASSPPLWKNSDSSSSTLISPSHPLLMNPSRRDAIAKGQFELMEMVKNLPESSYELSFKDLVDHREDDHHSPPRNDFQNLPDRKKRMSVKRQGSKKMVNFEDKGLFLNVVSPFSMMSRRRSPEVEKDWWKKKFTGSSDSDSSRTTTASGSSASSSGGDDGRKRNGCWKFCKSRKSKSDEE